MEELVRLVVDNGIGVACVIYLMYFQHTTMTKMLESMNLISERLAKIESKLDEN